MRSRTFFSGVLALITWLLAAPEVPAFGRTSTRRSCMRGLTYCHYRAGGPGQQIRSYATLDVRQPERRLARSKHDEIRMNSFGWFKNGLSSVTVLNDAFGAAPVVRVLGNDPFQSGLKRPVHEVPFGNGIDLKPEHITGGRQPISLFVLDSKV
jgi:hypothetical protein